MDEKKIKPLMGGKGVPHCFKEECPSYMFASMLCRINKKNAGNSTICEPFIIQQAARLELLEERWARVEEVLNREYMDCYPMVEDFIELLASELNINLNLEDKP